MKPEEWKDVVGYEGLYLISNYGKVISLYRFKSNGKGGYYQQTSFLKQYKTSTGYYRVDLFKDGKKKSFRVSRLVALHFVANPYGFDIVNHKDGNPLNNYFENLEWCRQVDNINHAYENELIPSFEIDKKSLEYLYIKQNKTPEEIGKIFGLSRFPIDTKINEYGLKKENVTKYQISEEWLKEQIKNKRKNKDIAKEVGCDESLISKYKQKILRGENIYA